MMSAVCKTRGNELPNLYFAHQREVFLRNGSLLAVTDFIQTEEKDNVSVKQFVFERSEIQHALVQSVHCTIDR